MRRIRWSDQDGTPAQADWRAPALVIAALFLNFSFWSRHGGDFWMFYPLPLYGCMLAAASALLTAMFFAGPAFACRLAGGGINMGLESSLGLVPAYCARLCCILFLVVWMATVVGLPTTGQLPFIVRRDVSPVQSGITGAVLLAVLFVTGIQGLGTSAKLAVFTNKLAVAILLAAVLRVREGWPAVLAGFRAAGRSEISDIRHGVSLLAFYVAPLAFLAAEYAGPKQSRRQLGMVALLGITLPVCGGLFIVGVMNVATHASPYYQPSLAPDMAMALWGKAAASALPPRMMLTAITLFGALRFGAKALANLLLTPLLGRVSRAILLGFCVVVIARLSTKLWTVNLDFSREVSGAILTILAAVLSADAVSGRFRKLQRGVWIDWVGLSAVVAGLIAAASIHEWAVPAGDEVWFRPWLFPSYTAAFCVCLVGRFLTGYWDRFHNGRGSVGDVSVESGSSV